VPGFQQQIDMSQEGALDINVDPNGDVILELSSPDGKKNLLVSSRVLSLASPVFRAMFASRFKEGLSNHSIPECPHVIHLPEDDAEAFTILCNVLHFRVDEIPRQPDLICLQNIANICDKYDCCSALAAQCTVWLYTWIESQSSPVDWKGLLFVAYVLDASDPFSRISWEILKAQVGPFVSLPGLTDHELVHGNLLGKMSSEDSAWLF
jgi:hypothetical protein